MGWDSGPKMVTVVIFKFNFVSFYVKMIFLFSEWPHFYQKMWENGWDNAFNITRRQRSFRVSRSWWAQPRLHLH